MACSTVPSGLRGDRSKAMAFSTVPARLRGDRSNAVAFVAPASPRDKSRHDIPSCVLIDLRAYNAIPSNAATAYSKTSQKEPIQVSFSAAQPPGLSHFAVCIPSRQTTSDIYMEPKVICADGDLVVLRVPQNPLARADRRFNDYFVYRIHAQRPQLYLLPNPRPEVFGDHEIAILNCGDGNYVLAALKSMSYGKPTFRLHLCRSTNGIPARWTSEVVSVAESLRDSVYPIPDSADMRAYHVTTKVITFGGDKGTVGWVDLWRGIILCDVLSENPNLRDMPLPLPAEGCQIIFRNTDPYFFRDITVNQAKDTIKYIEMEIRSKEVPATFSSECPQPNIVVAGSWKATTYTMPIPVTSWNNWHPKCHISSAQLQPSFHKFFKLQRVRMSSSGNNKQEATEATLSLRKLQMAHPTLSIGDDNIVYLLCKGTSMESKKVVVAVDVREHTMQGVAKIDNTHRTFGFSRHYLICGISKNLKAKGTRASVE